MQVIRLAVKYQQNPLRVARGLSYVNVAMHDAWLQCLGLPLNLAELAAHRAAALVIEQLYANETPGQFEAQFALFELALSQQLRQQPDALAVGVAVGSALIERSLHDGSSRIWSPKDRPAPFAGVWQPTYPMYAANPAEGYASQWQPWITRPTHRYQPPRAARPGSVQHADETREVLAVSRTLTEGNKQAARRWHLDAGSVTPAGVWLRLTLDELDADASGWSMDRAFPVLAAVSVAMHDAFIECWRVKMRDWSERPVTAVRRELDASFVPLLVTPGFPGYVSAHATVSAAAATVLAHFWPGHRTRFEALAEEAAMSRLWGGIHFRSDNDEGLLLGRGVGAEVVARLT